jgi:hypothetical protein
MNHKDSNHVSRADFLTVFRQLGGFKCEEDCDCKYNKCWMSCLDDSEGVDYEFMDFCTITKRKAVIPVTLYISSSGSSFIISSRRPGFYVSSRVDYMKTLRYFKCGTNLEKNKITSFNFEGYDIFRIHPIYKPILNRNRKKFKELMNSWRRLTQESVL